MKETKRIDAYFCDTPLQTLNVLNLRLHQMEEEPQSQAELIMVDQFRTANKLFDGIKKSGLFREAYLLPQEDRQKCTSSLRRHIGVTVDFLLPKQLLQRHGLDVQCIQNRYTTIYGAVLTHFLSALHKLNPQADFILYEDGTGSYSGNVVNKGSKKIYRAISSLIHAGAYAVQPKALYLNNPDAYKAEAICEIRQMPRMSDQLLRLAESVFGYQEDTADQNRKIIWLSQPSDGVPESYALKQKMADALKPFADQVLVRLHPRDKELELYEAFSLDKGENMWELVLLNQRMDDRALMAYYSTAQINPKLLYDQEPYLIFMYHYAGYQSPVPTDDIDRMIENIRSLYRQPEKIFVPETKDELTAVLDKLLAR